MKLLKKIVEITKKSYKQDPKHYLVYYNEVLNNLAVLYNETNQADKAIELEEEASRIKKKHGIQ